MKKLTFLIILAVAMTLAGCDTTDTTSVRINLGGSRAIPAGVSTVYVAAFPIVTVWYGPDSDDTLGGVAAAAAVPAGTSSVSLVVPADMDIFILVLAADSTGSVVFYRGENIYVNADGGTVQISMGEPNISGGSTYLYNSAGITSSDTGFTFELGNGRIFDIDLVPYLELHLEVSSDGGSSYDLIKKLPFAGFYQNQIGSFGVTAEGGKLYRARLYFIPLGMYFYEWGSYSSGT